MGPAFEAVVFDIGGVLENTPKTDWEQRWCAKLDTTKERLHQRLRPVWLAGTIGEITLEAVHQGIGSELDLSSHEVELFMEDLWTEYLGTPNSDLIDYFASLAGRFRTGILSNSFVGARERERERYGFESMCEVVVYSHEEGMKKPAIEFYRLVCQRLNVDPTKALFVDDHDAMLDGAAEIGMTPVKYVGQLETIRHLDQLLVGS